MVTSATLHWLLSQSFFLVRVDFFERNSNRASEGKSKSACGYSSLSLLILLIVSFVLMSAISWAISRRMQQRIPNAGSCSLVISAACHPIKGEVDAHLEQVKWVVVQFQEDNGTRHCSFSADPVKKPEAGVTYR
jgi:hypothetical protein